MKYKEDLQKTLVNMGCYGRENSQGCWLSTKDKNEMLSPLFETREAREALLDWAENNLNVIKQKIESFEKGWKN